MEVVSDIQKLKEKIDIVEYIGRYVNLSPAGKGNYKGLSPVRSEKTPSFYVLPEKNIWKDYSGGSGNMGKTGGDVFQFYRYLHPEVAFPEAVREVAKECGYVFAQTKAQKEKYENISRIERLLSDYQKVMAGNLEKNPATRKMLNERGVSDESIRRNGIGVSTLNDLNVLRKKGYTDQDFEKARIINKKNFPMFGTRITIPVRDKRGRTISFSGRTTKPKNENGEDAEMKYLNGADTEMYKRSRDIYLSLPAKNKSQGLLMLTEGCFDAIAVADAGYKAAAVLGTEASSEQMKRIADEETNVILMYDGDEAGRNKAKKTAFALLGEGCNVMVATLPPEHDPASYLAQGNSLLKFFQEGGAKDVFEWYMEGANFENLAGRRSAAEKMEKMLEACDPTSRDWYIRKFSEKMDMEDASVIFPRIFGKGEEKINELGLVRKEEKEIKEISYDKSDRAVALEEELFRTALRADSVKEISTGLHDEFFKGLAQKLIRNREEGINIVSGLTKGEISFIAGQKGFESKKEIGELVKEHRTAVVKKELESHKKAIARLEKELAMLETDTKSRGNAR